MKYVRPALGLLLGILFAAFIAPGVLGNPQIFEVRIHEVFSNSDGTIQFVELLATAQNQGVLGPMHIEARNPDGTFRNMILDWTDSVNTWLVSRTMLLATQKAADTLGFAPDFIIADGSIPIRHGRVLFMTDIGNVVDAVAYGNFTGSNTPFGTPAAMLPCDGFNSLTLTHIAIGARNNSADYSVLPNSPMRIDSTTGQIGPLVNTPPDIFYLGPRTVNEGSLILVNDTAIDCNGAVPVMTAASLPPGATFTDFGGGTGRLDWIPNYTQSGAYPVYFIAFDGTAYDSQAVTITVNNVTDPPVARDTLFNATQDVPLACFLPASDPDADSLFYKVLSGPAHGTVVGLDTLTGNFTYWPDVHYFGTDTLRFRVRDPRVNSNTATVAFSVAHVNVPPDAGSVWFLVKLDTPLPIGPMPVSDVDSPSWTITQTLGPFNGSVSAFFPTTGQFTYTPSTGYLGPDSIQYIAFDGEANSNTATIHLAVSTGCDCVYHGDPATDAMLDVFDVIHAVDAAFSGLPSIIDPTCPHGGRDDYNCDCSVDVFDVIAFIEGVFSGGVGPCNPCSLPCP